MFINTTQDHVLTFRKSKNGVTTKKLSVKYKGVSIWDNLLKSIKEIKTLNLFSKKIKTHFLHKQEN